MAVIVKLLSKFDDSGIKQAKKKFGGLKTAIGAIGIGIGISQITDLLMDSAKAASADAKSTKILNTQLVRNAGATKAQIKQSDKFIEKLSLQTGIFDDDLRPAYAKFANVTGNVKDAQKLLTVTVDAAAGSGKSQTKIANAVAKAYDGNTASLIGMFPELKKSKDVLGDFTEQYRGMAEINADPFMKFNNSMDILKEKLGAVILPLIITFVDEISKPGGLVDQVGKFLTDLSDPKTDTGQIFITLKESVAGAGESIGGLFALMDTSGGKNPMNGFVQALTYISDFIRGIADGVTALSGAMAKLGAGDYNGAIAILNAEVTLGAESVRRGLGVQETMAAINAETMSRGSGAFYAGDSTQGATYDVVGFGKPTGKLGTGIFANGKSLTNNNNVTINVLNADPKATVDALGRYIKTNGALPFSFATGKAGR